MTKNHKYDESSIKSLNWKEHIRKRPGMYIGKLGNGSSADDGVYILLKEIIDKGNKTLYLAIYNSNNQRSYITVKLK